MKNFFLWLLPDEIFSYKSFLKKIFIFSFFVWGVIIMMGLHLQHFSMFSGTDLLSLSCGSFYQAFQMCNFLLIGRVIVFIFAIFFILLALYNWLYFIVKNFQNVAGFRKIFVLLSFFLPIIFVGGTYIFMSAYFILQSKNFL